MTTEFVTKESETHGSGECCDTVNCEVSGNEFVFDNGIRIKSDDGTVWEIVVSNAGEITANEV